jgi:enterochelin esterase-like enzyme
MRVVRSHLLLCCFFVLSACQASNPLALPTDTPAPPTTTPPPTATPTPMPASLAGFDNFMAQALALKSDERQELVNRYVGGLTQAPITGDDEAIFLYRGAAQSVQLLGDMNNWDVRQAPAMTRLEGSDLWYWRNTFEPAARLDYRILVDGRDAALDPLNPNTAPGPAGPNSELRMPAYQTPPGLEQSGQPAPAGTLTSHTLDSQILGQTRTFQVYQPPGQIVGQRLPALFINNGSDYLNLIDAPAILDRLIAQRQIPPLLAVFITPINAQQEYAVDDAYAGFLAEELAPYIRETFGISADPAETAVLGNALGGVAAVHALLSHPDVFGLAAAQSAPFGQPDGALIRSARRQGTRPAAAEGPQIYLVAGAYETAVQGQDILQDNRQMAEALRQGGFDVLLDERPEGHSWGLWRGTLGPALSALFGPAS